MKRTQTEIIVRFLAARPGEWTPSYQLSKQQTDWGYIGSSGERRARELAEAGTYELDRVIYFIERCQNGKFAEYRVAFSQPKLPKFTYVDQPDGSKLEVPTAIPTQQSPTLFGR